MKDKYVVVSHNTQPVIPGGPAGGGCGHFGRYRKLSDARDRRDELELSSPSSTYEVARLLTREEIAGHRAAVELDDGDE